MKIGDKVTAWRYPKSNKHNFGEEGIIVEIIKSVKGLYYKVSTDRGSILSTANRLTNRSTN